MSANTTSISPEAKNLDTDTETAHEYIPIHIIIAIVVGTFIGLLILALVFTIVFKKRCCKAKENRCHIANSTRSVHSFSWISKRLSRRSSKSQQPFHPNVVKVADLAEFVRKNTVIYQEFREAPRIRAHREKVPKGCETKNRYVNVFPIDESRVRLQRLNGDDTTEYINANYIKALNGSPNYYIACQAPLESTVEDFWRMIWEQESHVIIQLTNLIENGKAMCAKYLPSSEALETHISCGNYQIAIEHREAKNRYTISTVYVSNIVENTQRKITHYWYNWPDMGVPSEQESIVAMLSEVRISLKAHAQEVEKELQEKPPNNKIKRTSTVSDKQALYQGPLVVHCSSGTGRAGTIVACDMAIQSIESNGSLDLPRVLYHIRQGRAKAISTREQYEFVYKVAYHYTLKFANMYKVDIE